MDKLFLASALSLGIFSTQIYASPTFNEEQLSQFEKTNQCVNCDLSGAPLTGNHSKANLVNANLSGIISAWGFINFSEANLRNANLSGTQLSGANFSKADLTGAVFAGAVLNYANFYGATGVNLNNALETCNVTTPDGSILKC